MTDIHIYVTRLNMWVIVYGPNNSQSNYGFLQCLIIDMLSQHPPFSVNVPGDASHLNLRHVTLKHERSYSRTCMCFTPVAGSSRLRYLT